MSSSTPRVACFGYVNPGVVFSVEAYPAANTGAYVLDKRPFIGADCAMAARLLAHWGVQAHLIGNALGDDELGRHTLQTLNAHGVHTHIDLRRHLHTPDEVDISDRAGTRTFFVEHAPDVWNSLADADLDPIRRADMVYVDWYVGPPALAAIEFANAHGVPVFLNVEYSLREPERYRALIAQSTYAQSPMSDVHVHQEDPYAIAHALHALGVQLAFVTRGKHGSLALHGSQFIAAPAPIVQVVDTQGAGAVYSAAAIYGLLAGWPIEDVVQFATTAATLKCARYGLIEMSVDDIWQFVPPTTPHTRPDTR